MLPLHSFQPPPLSLPSSPTSSLRASPLRPRSHSPAPSLRLTDPLPPHTTRRRNLWEREREKSSPSLALSQRMSSPPSPWNVHLWDASTVLDWLHSVGLHQCVPTFHTAAINGRELLHLSPAVIGRFLELETDDQLSLCAALQPLKDEWRRWHMAQRGSAAREDSEPQGQLSDSLVLRQSTRSGDLGPLEGELSVSLSLWTMPERVAGVYVILEMAGNSIQSEAMLQPSAKGEGTQAFCIPVHSKQMGAVLRLKCHAWLPRAGERTVGESKVALTSVVEGGMLEKDLGPLHVEVSWQPMGPSFRHSPGGALCKSAGYDALPHVQYPSCPSRAGRWQGGNSQPSSGGMAAQRFDTSRIPAEGEWMRRGSGAHATTKESSHATFERLRRSVPMTADEEWDRDYSTLQQQYKEEMNDLLSRLLPPA